MTEVGPADRLKQLRSKRAESSSIVTSRKRKLRELYAIATGEDGIPNFDFSDPDAPPPTEAEAKFLLECDILQGRRLNEQCIPRRRKPRFDKILLTPNLPAEIISPAITKPTAEGELSSLPFDAAAPTRARDVLGRQLSGKAANTLVKSASVEAAQRSDAEGALIESSPSAPLPPPPKELTASQPPAQAANDELAREPDQTTPQLAVSVDISLQSKSDGGTTTAVTNGDVAGVDPVPRPSSLVDHPGAKDIDAALDARLSHGDGSRYPDALSSPGSTAHSTLTPAVHDVSTDTSPDNEGPQYIERNEEGPGGKELEGHSSDRVHSGQVNGMFQAESPSPIRDSLPATISGVEAQLLQESAAAQLSRLESSDEPLHHAPDGNAPVLQSLDALVPPEDTVSPGISKGVVANTSQQLPTNQTVKPAETRSEALALPLDLDVPPATATAGSGNEKGKPTVPTILVEPPSQDATQEPTRVSAIQSQIGTTLVNGVTDATRSPQQEPGIAEADRDQPRRSDSTSEKEEKTSLSQPLSAPQLKLLANDLRQNRQKRRRSVPTVIFGKQTKRPRVSDDTALVPNKQKPGGVPTDDYFTPLFIEGFARSSTWMKPIEKLLNQAHKTVSTTDQYVPILDHQACKILRRVYHLQQHDKWSLRQPVRCQEPIRQSAHWDVLLQEMKWMRTDFREERKWKRAVARNLAYACAEWVLSGSVERLALQVNATIPPLPTVSDADVEMADAVDASLPELVHSDSPRDNEDEPIEVLVETVAPSMIFAYSNDEVVFGLQQSKATDLLLENLPMYGSPLKIPKFDLAVPDYDPDAHWKRPALPLSKYVEGEMILVAKPPPRKRSRYQYMGEDEDEDEEEVIFGDVPDRDVVAKPENTNVALFSEEMKTTRDRLHAGHQFRPPTDHPMPLQSFYESRIASQWTWAEDDQLKSLVQDYSYNWSLISSIMSTRSLFASGAERRTPWECFERWVSLVGLPNDMAKTPYFKTYQSRIDAAQRVIMQQNNTAQQHVGPNGAVTPVPKKRPTTTVRVERRRNQKHLALIDAMRKLAKKREGAAQKAANAASMASQRKPPEAPRQQVQNKTPRDYSIMRWERDQQLAEKMALYAQRHQEAIQKRVMQQRQSHAGQGSGTPGAPPAMPTAERMVSATPLNNVAAARLNIPPHLAVPLQAQPQSRVQIQAPSVPVPAVPAQLAGGLVPPMQMAGMQQAQLQALQAQRMSMANAQPTMNTIIQARLIQEQQQRAVQAQIQQQQQQQQQPVQHQNQQQPQPQKPQPQQQQQAQLSQQQQQQMARANSAQGSPTPMRNVMNMNNIGQPYSMNAQAMMAQYNATQMATSPGAAGLSMPLPAGSPRPAMTATMLRLKELEGQYRLKHPTLAQDQIRQLAIEHLGKLVVQNQRIAMESAAGSPVVPLHAANAMISATTSPHQYAQILRAQQQQQAAQAAQAAQQQAGQQSAGQQAMPQQIQQTTVQQQQAAQVMAHQLAAQRAANIQAAQAQAVAQAQAAQVQAAQVHASQAQAAQAAHQHQRQASGSATPAPSK